MYIWRHVPFPTCCGRRKAQQKVKERWCKRISCDIEGVYTLGLCISRFFSEKIYSTWTRKIGIETRRQIFQRHLAPNRNSGKKGSITRNYPKVCASMSVAFARQNSRKDHMRRPCTKKELRRQSSMEFGVKSVQAQEFGQSYVVFFFWSEGDAGTHVEKSRGARIRSRFRSINGHDEQKKN